MNSVIEKTNNMRRTGDLPLLVLSQDYELFFGQSGSLEKCLIEPCKLLLDFAAKRDIKVTFFVDAGMLVAMEREAASAPEVHRSLDRIRRHIGSLSDAGHEIGLHVHPHWEETRWESGAWRFGGTRYQLREFPGDEIERILESYANVLKDLSNGGLKSYRAGGFCVEPFGLIGATLRRLGITLDSSVVPGAALVDQDKGFDHRMAPDRSWWRFSDSPLCPDPNGEFVEIPVTPVRLPVSYYWFRLADRLLGRRSTDMLGDGISKSIGRREVIRRLAGVGLVSELSLDAPKAGRLIADRIESQQREVWQVMGHPKLLGESSLRSLDLFMKRAGIRRTMTLSDLGKNVSVT